MKDNIKKIIFILTFATISIFVTFRFIDKGFFRIVPASATMDQISRVEIRKEEQRIPKYLIIPKIDVITAVNYVGITPTGEMEAPKNPSEVGWFSLGPKLGEKGSVVIAGHFNAKDSSVAIFSNLNKLEKGDKIYIEDNNKTSTAFIVRESRKYDPGYAEEVFTSNDGVHLNLVTCDGVWDESKKSFSKRLVVFADIVD